MKLSRITVMFLAITFGLFISCSSAIRVSVKRERSFDFAKLKTYSWVPKEHGGVLFAGLPVNIDVRNGIQAAIDHELAQKSFQQVSADSADFWLRPYGGIEDQEVRGGAGSVASMHTDRLYEPTLDNPEPYLELSEPSGGLRSGTLVLEVIETGSKQVVWKGTAEGVVNESTSDDAEVARFVTALLKRFPPTSKPSN